MSRTGPAILGCAVVLATAAAVVWAAQPTLDPAPSPGPAVEVDPEQTLAPAGRLRHTTDAATTPVSSPLPTPGRITGTVIDSRNRAIAGASVLWTSNRTGATGDTRTGSSGGFGIECEVGERISLALHHTGFASQTRRAVPAAQSLVVRLEPGRVVRGVVVDRCTGQPLTGSSGTVFATWGLDVASPHHPLEADGTFRLGGLPDGTVRIAIRVAGYETFERGGLTVTEFEPWLRCALEPARGIRGRVISASDRQPIAGAVVTYLADFPAEAGSQTVQQHTNTEGAFRFDDLRATATTLEVRAAGYRSKAHANSASPGDLLFELKPGSDDLVVTVTERGMPQADVRVVCAQGSTRQAATSDRQGEVRFRRLALGLPARLRADTDTLTARGRWTHGDGTHSGDHRFHLDLVEPATLVVTSVHEWWRGAEVLLQTPAETVVGTIDETGVCRLSRLPPGSATVRVGERRLHVAQVMLASGRNHEVELDSDEVRQLQLRVVDDAGEPVPGAAWTCRSSQTRRRGESSGHTDAAGEMDCTVIGEAGFVSITAPGFETLTDRRVAAAPAAPAVQQIELEPKRIIRGTVTDRRTLRGIREFEITIASGTNVRRVWSPDGAFVVDRPRGAIEIAVFRAAGYLPSAPIELLDSPADLEVQLDPLGGIHGRVLDPGGRPVVGVDVVLTDPTKGEDTAQQSTGANGEFTFSGTSYGPRRLRVVAAGRSLATADAQVLDPTAPTSIELRIATLPAAHLLVFRPDGTPCVGATSKWHRLEASTRTRSVHTDRDGYATVPDLLPGRYLITTRLRTRGTTIETEIQMSDLEPLVQVTLPFEHR